MFFFVVSFLAMKRRVDRQKRKEEQRLHAKEMITAQYLGEVTVLFVLRMS